MDDLIDKEEETYSRNSEILEEKEVKKKNMTKKALVCQQTNKKWQNYTRRNTSGISHKRQENIHMSW
jgi:hypothetical protein